jgi:hypothetical protein
VTESFGIIGLRESKISEEITFSREKVRPKIVGLTERRRDDALNIYKALPSWDNPRLLDQRSGK